MATKPFVDQKADAVHGEGHRAGVASGVIPGICLIGCGWWGGVHALALKAIGPRVCRYFASQNPDHARDFARRFDGTEIPGGMAGALKDARVDAVILALPHHLHAEATLAALRAGKHVLVEKPLALNLEEGEKMVRLAEDSGLCLAVAEEYRLSPLVVRTRDLIRQGRLGRVLFVQANTIGNFRPPQRWKQSRESMGGGVLLDVGIHYIDVLRFWFGEPERVWATSPPQINPEIGGEDSISAVLNFPNGPVANLRITWSGHPPPGMSTFELCAERGSLTFSYQKPWLTHSEPLPPDHWSQRVQGRLPWRIERRLLPFLPKSRLRRLPVEDDDKIGNRALIHDFVQAITCGQAPAVSGMEGLKDLRVVLAAYESLRSGKAVPLP